MTVKAKIPRIFVALPTVDSKIHVDLMVTLMKWVAIPKWKLTIFSVKGYIPHDNARNTAVKSFLKTDCDYILFIDSDIVPPENTLEKLLAENVDIIAPLCPILRADEQGKMAPTIVAGRYAEDGINYKTYFGTGVEEVDFLTGGMQLIKRKVMERLEVPYYFTYNKGIIVHSEDVIFSKQCQELGYKLYTDFSLFCSHYKELDVRDYHAVLSKHMKNK